MWPALALNLDYGIFKRQGRRIKLPTPLSSANRNVDIKSDYSVIEQSRPPRGRLPDFINPSIRHTCAPNALVESRVSICGHIAHGREEGSRGNLLDRYHAPSEVALSTSNISRPPCGRLPDDLVYHSIRHARVPNTLVESGVGIQVWSRHVHHGRGHLSLDDLAVGSQTISSIPPIRPQHRMQPHHALNLLDGAHASSEVALPKSNLYRSPYSRLSNDIIYPFIRHAYVPNTLVQSGDCMYITSTDPIRQAKRRCQPRTSLDDLTAGYRMISSIPPYVCVPDTPVESGVGTYITGAGVPL
ncbi:hypothetical protein BDZ89DRAFT_1045322 [Hymenopellis radicata]|nr:hypothetical protein BDZ89DRAFT_1045322 [Hymenopellis radicata]